MRAGFAHLFISLIRLSEIGGCDIRSVDEWTSVLRIATRLSIPPLCARAICEIESTATPIDKAAIAREFNLGDSWLLPAFTAICEADKWLNYEDASGNNSVALVTSPLPCAQVPFSCPWSIRPHLRWPQPKHCPDTPRRVFRDSPRRLTQSRSSLPRHRLHVVLKAPRRIAYLHARTILLLFTPESRASAPGLRIRLSSNSR